MKCLKRNQERVSDETDAPRSGVPTVIKISGTYCSETSDAAYRECNSLLLEHWVELVHLTWAERLTKQMPAAFYIIFHLRHLHIQDYDRLVPVVSALLLICTAINYSCNKNGCSIKMWWHKCFAACFSGLLVHLAVVWPYPFPTICTVSLAPRAKQAHADLALVTLLCLLSHFGTCWPIFLLLMQLSANTINTTFSPFLPCKIFCLLRIILLEYTFLCGS